MKKRYEKDPEISKKETVEPIEGSTKKIWKSTKNSKKVVQFTSSRLTSRLKDGDENPQILDWQWFDELYPLHGFLAINSVLNDGLFGPNGRHPIEKLLSDIRGQFGESEWTVFENHYNSLYDPKEKLDPYNSLHDPEETPDRSAIYAMAVWAELFADPFGEFWLAAMARHAFWVEENHCAFGYLIALLDQKRQNEEHFLRGKKNLASAREGGRTRSKRQKVRTEAILDKMKGLVEAGHSVSNAASIVAKLGQGTSPDANKKLWYRRVKK